MNPEKAAPLVADDVYYHDPAQRRPPTGKKILCLTPGGVGIIGIWQPEYIGWREMPRIPETIKQKRRTPHD